MPRRREPAESPRRRLQAQPLLWVSLPHCLNRSFVPVRPCRPFGVRYNERMKTLTITEGRGRLGYWLKKAAQGEDIGFMFEGKIVALRPVEVVSTDYALQEYGLTPGEMAAAERRIGADIKAARKRGELTPFTGSENDFH